MTNLYEPISLKIRGWDSSALEDARDWPICLNCYLPIKENEIVIEERFLYAGRFFIDYWHPECWEGDQPE